MLKIFFIALPTDFDKQSFKTLKSCFGANALNVIDMGGLKSERRKWIHSFQNTNIVIFFVDISAFDQIIPQHLNKLYESKLIFESAMELFRHCSFIIFLNKLDLFEVIQQTNCIL